MTARPTTPLDEVCNDFVDASCQLFPELAISLGRDTGERAFSRFSPDGVRDHRDLLARTLRLANEAEVRDDVDRITLAALRESLTSELDCIDAGLTIGEVGVIATPIQSIRDHFDLMDRDSEDDWATIASHLESVPAAIDEFTEGLASVLATEHHPTLVQTRAVIDDLAAQTSDTGAWMRLASEYAGTENPHSALLARLRTAGEAANVRAEQLRRWIETDVLPGARVDDAVGGDVYALRSRGFLGTTIDTDAAYQWALMRLADIDRQQRAIARELYGEGVSVREALERLNHDERYRVHGTAALQRWMQDTADEAMHVLSGTHFTVPDAMRRIECCIAQSGDGSIYYTGPSDDFSRPGRMWWAVPPGQEVFHTWQEKTTVYHEGMPGHHMQIGVATANRDTLNDWRRTCWYSGHGEGWALYAEELMDHLGFLADPAERMGMLDAQRLRAARVIVDIGLHTRRPRLTALERREVGIDDDTWADALASSPFAGVPSVSGEVWTREDVWAFMSSNVAMLPSFLAFEVNRYLGWAGQASSYALGQHEWQRCRDLYLAAHPDASLRDFHDQALTHGGLPLATLPIALGVEPDPTGVGASMNAGTR